MKVLDSIPVRLGVERVLKRLHQSKENKYMESIVQELMEIVRPIAKPKAVYEVSFIDNKNENSVDINGIRFTSHVLRVNLDKVGRVFPYVVTCGRELDEINIPSHEFLKYYCLDQIKETTVVLAKEYLEGYLTRSYALEQISGMAPGSLADWPITQQKELFSIFGGKQKVEDLIGVKLTDRCLMLPLKSVSGIYFPTKCKFESCQLCPREECIGRKAPYDLELVKKYQEKM